MKLYYKVVYESMNKYYSATVHPTIYCVEYIIGEKSYPVNGTNGIFVFNSIKAAKKFYDSMSDRDLEIFSCEVENPEKIINRGYPSDFGIHLFWSNQSHLDRLKEQFMLLPCPEDTFLVSSVTLLERIPKESL